MIKIEINILNLYQLNISIPIKFCLCFPDKHMFYFLRPPQTHVLFSQKKRLPGNGHTFSHGNKKKVTIEMTKQ